MDDKQSASFIDQVKNINQSAQNVIQDFVNGNQIFATEKIQNERWDICNGCDWLDINNQKCKKCGCFLTAKIKFNSSFCPLYKWNSITVSE